MDHSLYHPISQNAHSFITQRGFILFILVTLIVWYIRYLWNRRKLYWHSMKIPGPWGLPIIGTGYMFLGTGSEILNRLLKLQQNWSGICKLWMGQELIVMISKPEHIEIILNSPYAIEKHELYDILSEVLGKGILTVEETAMGVNMNIQSDNEEDIGKCLETLMELANERIFRIWLQFPLFWRFSKVKEEFDKNIRHFQSVTSKVIRKKMEEYNQQKKLSEDCTFEEIPENSKKKRLAFLDLILENSDFNEEELRAEMETFIGAGTETSATTLCAVFTVLGILPEIQEKVFEEVLDIVGPDRDVEARDLAKMKYTERVIKETLRLFPVAAVFARTLTEDINLGDMMLPSGCSVGFCGVYIHRNPEYWKNPLKFDPDRFLTEEVVKRHPCTYVPFSYGPRNCIGGRYAVLNIKTVLATVIRQFKIFSEYKSIEEIELKIQLLLRFKDGFKIWLESR